MEEKNEAVIFRIALTAGELLIKNGAEMHRTEETILRICSSHGITGLAVFITPTVILIGNDKKEGSTYIKNIRVRGSNIHKISLVNEFSRNFTQGKISENEAYQYAAYSQTYPKFKVTDALRRNGFKDDFHDIAPTTLFSALLSDKRAEMNIVEVIPNLYCLCKIGIILLFTMSTNCCFSNFRST